MKTCVFCGKECPSHLNYCNWDCHIGEAKKQGGCVHLPNDLKIACIKADGTMLEHAHGDHPDYMFPVTIDYVAPINEDDFHDYEMCTGKARAEADTNDIRHFRRERHALIYTDGTRALTLYECAYALWNLRSGKILNDKALWKKDDWKMSDASIAKIVSYKQKAPAGELK